MKICVVIPIHNEAVAIGGLTGRVRSYGLDVVVIDDGSTDSGGKLAQGRGATVIVHPTRQGKGLSLRDGFAYALSRGYEGVIAMDGDGQHAPEDLPRFLERIRVAPPGVICGTRMQDCLSMPWLRRQTNRVMSRIISGLCGQDIPDTQCGYRYIAAETLKAMQLDSTDFEIESEVLIQASQKGFQVQSIPIQTIYHNEDSKINPVADTLRFVIFLGKVLCRRKSKG